MRKLMTIDSTMRGRCCVGRFDNRLWIKVGRRYFRITHFNFGGGLGASTILFERIA